MQQNINRKNSHDRYLFKEEFFVQRDQGQAQIPHLQNPILIKQLYAKNEDLDLSQNLKDCRETHQISDPISILLYYKSIYLLILMRTLNENNNQILSLAEWPEKPIEKQHYKLSPISAKILTNQGFSLPQILPASVNDYLGIKILNQQDFEDLIHEYILFDRERMKKLNKLKKKREEYEQREMILEQQSSLQKSVKINKKNIENESNQQLRPCAMIFTKKLSKTNAPVFREIQNASTNFEIMGERDSHQNKGSERFFLNNREHQLQSNIICPRLVQSNEADDEESPSTAKKANHTQSSNLVPGILKDKAFMSKKSVKWQPSLIRPFQNYGSFSSIKLHKIKQTEGTKVKIHFPDKKKKKVGQKEKIKNRKSLSIKNSSSQQTKKKSKLKDTFFRNNLTKSRNSPSVQVYTDRPHMNQKELNYSPKVQYYNKTTLKLTKKNKKQKTGAKESHMVNQMLKATDELLNLAQKQEYEMKTLENLHASDGLSQKEKGRLSKIHDLERDQVKNHIHELKKKISSMQVESRIDICNTL